MASDLASIKRWNDLAFAEYEAGHTPRAVQWFRKGARMKHPVSQYNLAVIGYRGEHRGISPAEVLRLLRRSAAGGFAPAQFMLAELLDAGRDLPRDSEQAHGLYLAAARQGHPQAAASLGVQFLLGRGTAQDDVQAAYWYNQAAAAGDMAAQYTMGAFLERGTGISRDLRAAVRWYSAAARQGDVAAREKARELTEILARGE